MSAAPRLRNMPPAGVQLLFQTRRWVLLLWLLGLGSLLYRQLVPSTALPGTAANLAHADANVDAATEPEMLPAHVAPTHYDLHLAFELGATQFEGWCALQPFGCAATHAPHAH
eukprot:SAG11_NODE_3294_length_2546_cov_1.591745_1_plen_113_part_00